MASRIRQFPPSSSLPGAPSGLRESAGRARGRVTLLGSGVPARLGGAVAAAGLVWLAFAWAIG